MPCIRLLVGERERANLVVQRRDFYDRVRRVSAHARLRYALQYFQMCYLRMRQDNALLHAVMMARADTFDCVLAPARQKYHALAY